jgi:hypothetical protein
MGESDRLLASIATKIRIFATMSVGVTQKRGVLEYSAALNWAACDAGDGPGWIRMGTRRICGVAACTV